MRVVGLISGGKDSIYNMMQCVSAGHHIVAVANIQPHEPTEIDSYMYQSVGHEAIELIAEAMQLPLFRKVTAGVAAQKGKVYVPTAEDEVEDLFELLLEARSKVEFEGVSVGAILSDYQRVRVENVCVRLGLTSLCYLWQRNQGQLLDEMIRCEVDAVIVKVAALGLEPGRHLGRSLRLLESHLRDLHEKYGINICGEGGEYETLTLDCPLFESRLVIEDSEIILHSKDKIAQVGFLNLKKLRLETKLPALDLKGRLAGLPLKDSDGHVTDVSEEDSNEDEPDEPETSDPQPILLSDSIIIDQTPTGRKSVYGWLWSGGLHGDSSDPSTSMLQALDKLQWLLKENGQSVTDLCKVNMFVRDMGQYKELNEVYCKILGHANPPSRACVEVPLPKECPVLLEALSWCAPVGNATGDSPVERSTMHVQSISHWAPANIGPYSQAVRVGDVVHLAGQIALVPGSGTLVQGGIKKQCRLALRHVDRLLSAVDSNMNVRNVVQGICYVTHEKYISHARKLWEERTNSAIINYVIVSGLPRNAAVEWQVWAHRHNGQFEYEETGKCVSGCSILMYRRWNYENNTSAVVCHVEGPRDDGERGHPEDIFTEAVDYALRKLRQGQEGDCGSVYNVKVFCPVTGDVVRPGCLEKLAETEMNLAFTLVPVVGLHSRKTLLSICGVRNQ